MAKKEPPEVRIIAGREVTITSPSRVYFPALRLTKRDLIDYFFAVSEGALRGIRGRPLVLKRFVKGIRQKPFFQKRAPKGRPPWLEVATLTYPSGRSADEVVVVDAAGLAWINNLGCLDLNPHPTRHDDLEHPDELRVDLDPTAGVGFEDVRAVALVVRDVLEDVGLLGFPKTSGSKGMHVLVRIERRWTFTEVRQAAQNLAREVARRLPDKATARWWKEERHGVFVDFNQNAKDRTVASAYSVRPRPDARVSAPLHWDEVADCDPAAFTMLTMPDRFAALGDLHASIDEVQGSLDPLLDLEDEHRRRGLLDEEPRPEAKEGRRTPRVPVHTVAQAADEADALAGLERWRARHPEAAAHLGPEDILVDGMRGRSSLWYRVRVRLQNVPEAVRPPTDEPPDPDDDPWRRG